MLEDRAVLPDPSASPLNGIESLKSHTICHLLDTYLLGFSPAHPLEYSHRYIKIESSIYLE